MPGAPPVPGAGLRAGLTREGVVGVEEVDLLAAIAVDVAGCHTDGVALPVSQGVVRGAPHILCHVHQPPPCLVILEHQVGAIVPGSVSRGVGSPRLGDGMKAPVSSLGGHWVQYWIFPMMGTTGICMARGGQGPCQASHVWQYQGSSGGQADSSTGWGAAPCLQSFPRARKPARKANPLSTVRPTGSLPAPAQCTSKQVIQRAPQLLIKPRLPS